MWEEASNEFKILLIASEIVITLIVFFVLFKVFSKFKKDDDSHKESMKDWDKD